MYTMDTQDRSFIAHNCHIWWDVISVIIQFYANKMWNTCYFFIWKRGKIHISHTENLHILQYAWKDLGKPIWYIRKGIYSLFKKVKHTVVFFTDLHKTLRFLKRIALILFCMLSVHDAFYFGWYNFFYRMMYREI